MGIFCLQSILFIFGISSFLFFTIEHMRKPGNLGIKTVYLISSIFLSILCDQKTTPSVGQSCQRAPTIEA